MQIFAPIILTHLCYSRCLSVRSATYIHPTATHAMTFVPYPGRQLPESKAPDPGCNSPFQPDAAKSAMTYSISTSASAGDHAMLRNGHQNLSVSNATFYGVQPIGSTFSSIPGPLSPQERFISTAFHPSLGQSTPDEGLFAKQNMLLARMTRHLSLT